MDRKIIVAGAVGVGLLGYLLWRQQKDAEAAALLSAGIQPVRPGLTETFVGAATSVFSKGLESLTKPSTSSTPVKTGLEALQEKMRKRGDAHFLAWSASFRKGLPSYTVGGKCFRTADGAELPRTSCPVLQLEGYY
jgi:hypothetical protein